MNKKLIRMYFRSMGYRKLFADQIFDGFSLLKNQVLITDDAGKVVELISREFAGDDIEIYKGILSPGFINCHCHLELSHLRGRIPEKTGLVDFVYKVVAERHYPNQEIQEAIAFAEDEMLKKGIVAVGDICNNNSTVYQKEKQRLHYYNFIETSGWMPTVAAARFERAKILLEEFEKITTANIIGNSMVPHAPYSVSEGLWQKMKQFFDGRVISIHNQETPFEDEFFKTGKGDFLRMYSMMNIDNKHHVATKKSSLQSYFHHLKKASSVILVHNTYTSQEDVDYVNKSIANKENEKKLSTYFCLCVNANLFIQDALPPVELFRKNNCKIVLGTDSLASNYSLSILDEIKTIQKHFTDIPLKEILQWATSNGAKALEIDDQFGSLEEGKTPGVILINEAFNQVERLL